MCEQSLVRSPATKIIFFTRTSSPQKVEIPWSMCCRIQTRSPTSKCSELAPEVGDLSQIHFVLTIEVLVHQPRQTMPRDEDESSRASSETMPSCASYQNCLRTITRARLLCNTRWPAKQTGALFVAVHSLGDEHTPFRDCIFFRKGIYRSAIAAVTPDGGGNWMASEDLEPLKGGSSVLARAEGELEPLFGESGSRPKIWIAAAYGGAVAFR